MSMNRIPVADLILRDQHGTPFPLQPITLIGREAECQIVLSDSKVSRYHAKITIKSPTVVLVEDLHSSNGTFINGQRVHAPRTMTIGDELRLHKVSLRLATTQSGDANATMIGDGTLLHTAMPSAAAAQPVPPSSPPPAQSAQPSQPVRPMPAEPPPSIIPEGDATYLLGVADLAQLRETPRGEIHPQRAGDASGPCLVVLSAPIRGKIFPLRAQGAIGSWSIGRSGDVDLELIDRAVSRQHARIVKHGMRWQIANLNAANKIYVNGQSVESADLQSGDRIRLGRTEIEFSLNYNAADSVPPVTPVGMDRRLLLLGGGLLLALLVVIAALLLFRR